MLFRGSPPFIEAFMPDLHGSAPVVCRPAARTLARASSPISASAASPRASTLIDSAHLAARTREILPLNLGGACPMSEA